MADVAVKCPACDKVVLRAEHGQGTAKCARCRLVFTWAVLRAV